MKKTKKIFSHTSHSINNGADCVAEVLTLTGFVFGRHVDVVHIDDDIGLGSLAPIRLYAIIRNV